MALEIERRFLVRGLAWRQHERWRAELRQGYLSSAADGLTVRVRADDQGAAWLTLKLPAAGIARQEFEYAIPALDAQALLDQCSVAVVKQRHGLDLPGGDWVLDVFGGANAPLVIAEVELPAADHPVPIPSWCSHEITAVGAFSNAALAARPFAHWPEAERQPWLRHLSAEPS